MEPLFVDHLELRLSVASQLLLLLLSYLPRVDQYWIKPVAWLFNRAISFVECCGLHRGCPWHFRVSQLPDTWLLVSLTPITLIVLIILIHFAFSFKRGFTLLIGKWMVILSYFGTCIVHKQLPCSQRDSHPVLLWLFKLRTQWCNSLISISCIITISSSQWLCLYLLDRQYTSQIRTNLSPLLTALSDP